MSTGDVEEHGHPDEQERPIGEHRKAANRAWLITNLLLIAGLAVLVLAVPAIALRLHHSARKNGLQRPSAAYSQLGRSDSVIPKAVMPDRGTATKGAARFDVTLMKLKSDLQRTSLQLTFDTAQQAINHLCEAEHEWSELYTQTKSDSVGRKIAADNSLLMRFIALEELRKHHRPQHTRVSAQDGFDQLRALSPKETSDFESLSSVVEVLGRKAFDTAVFHKACTCSLLQLRECASGSPTGAHTLSAQRRIVNETSNAELDEVAEAAAGKLRRQLTNELAALNEDLVNATTQVTDLSRDLALLRRGESPGSSSAAQSHSVASRDDYVKDMPAIRSLLKPLTTPGYAQPKSSDTMSYESTKRPISYSALKRIGALRQNSGISILFRVGGAKSTAQQNNRPLGDFPRMYSLKLLDNSDVRSRVEEAQRLLLLYGPFLIEDGLLEP